MHENLLLTVFSYNSMVYHYIPDSTDLSLKQQPIPLDGGYGWIVVLASFFIHFICDGISFSFGIMFPEIQEYFNATKTMSGVVGSIFLSIPLLSGPLAGALTDIYGCRRMTIIGGLIAAAGGFLSFFAFNVWHFLFSFAFITGIGLSFCFNTAIVAVTYYFEKKRAIATGFAVCGSGAGTIVLAPFIEMVSLVFEMHHYKFVFYAAKDIVPASHDFCNSHQLTPFSPAQSRVPATNANFMSQAKPFGVVLCRRIPSAPTLCYLKKRKQRLAQLQKVNVIFCIFLLSTFILYIFFDIPYVNLPEYAVENHNLTETEASYLVSGIGLTNMVSMLICGVLADWHRHIILLYGLFITLAGLCVTLVPFANSYFHLMSLCIGFGFFISANFTLASVITLQILCLYNFQIGYGILCLVEGLGNLIGPASVGFIRDNLSGYDNIFIFGGAGTMLSGLMVIGIEICLLFKLNFKE
ncbi:unnamed protein product [Thelazia callipaeda]|uniref:MFS domain-containing protein n=1 Tax=Thelazia callipaeda TaxID=103827 RepID=A0A0N5D9C2_THECL|nr:unnamed protein product [Thelazia callipaeda]